MIFWILALLVQTESMGGADFQEGLRQISMIKDEVSIELNDSNFDITVTSSKDPWFIYLFHPNCFKCTIFSPQWKFFAEAVKDEGSRINIAKVNLLKSPNTAKRLMISVFPSFLYLNDGYIYNYTGKTESRELKQVYLNQTYLMYDRNPLPPPITIYREVYFIARFYIRKIVKDHSMVVISLSVLVCLVAYIGSRCLRRRKQKVD